MEKVKDIELPFFYGFYNSPFELNDYDIDEFISDYNEYSGEADIDFDDLDIDYETHNKVMVDCFVESIKEHLPSWVVDIKNPELDSPK